MTRTLHMIVTVVALIVAALLADAWLSARRTSAQLSATLATQNIAIQQASAREDQRATQLSAALATIATQQHRVQTPQQAAAAIPSLFPQLPLPLSIHLPDITSSPNQAEPPPASISVPQSDLKPIYDHLQECRVCALERDATKKDLADELAQVAALTHERDIAISAVHGGTFWSRLKHETKWLVIGIVAGAAATAAVHR
jgi:hypothetical protein